MEPYLAAAKPALDKVKAHKESHPDWQVSDVISRTETGEVLQWVDLVLAGGGVLGIALVGFTYVLEEAGIRFSGLGGTSAGAINAMLIAALRNHPEEKSSDKLLSILADTDFELFLDGSANAEAPAGLEMFTAVGKEQLQAVAKKGNKTAKLTLEAVQAYKDVTMSNSSGGKMGWTGWLGVTCRALHMILVHATSFNELFKFRGLHRGKYFEAWTAHHMGSATTIEELNKHLQFDRATTKLELREGVELDSGRSLPKESKLKIVAADISRQLRAVFPDEKKIYWGERPVHPAEFVRASMSIPIFFHPKEVPKPAVGQSSKVTLVDGGIMSNFPMDLFHSPERVPLYPTFGAQLGADKGKEQDASTLLTLLGAVFNSSKNILDHDYIEQNADKKSVITSIATDGFFWLDFGMTAQKRQQLFAKGADAAADFLLKFDWKMYKELRRQQMQAIASLPADVRQGLSHSAVQLKFS